CRASHGQRQRRTAVSRYTATRGLARRQGDVAAIARRHRSDNRGARRGGDPLSRPRYCIGIDLGTTNSAVAYADTTAGKRVEVFAVPQLVAEGTLAALPTLPSFLYLAGEHEIAPGALALPWDTARTFAVGTFARIQGTRVPGRLVSSAKSWLCHGGVDRTA